MLPSKIRKGVFVVAVGVLALGCELLVDFDRTKIPVDGSDGAIGIQGDAPSGDTGSVDASPDAQDASSDASDAASEADAVTDASDDAPDGD